MRKLAGFAFAFSAAIFLFQYFLHERWGLYALALPAAVLLACLLLRRRGWARFGAVLSLGALLGLGWCLGYAQLVSLPAAALSGTEGEVRILVTDYPSPSAYSYKLPGRLLREEGLPLGVQLYLPYGDEGAELEPGDELTLRARLLLASEKTENDVFASRGTPLFAYARSSYTETGRAQLAALRFLPRRAARAIREKIDAVFPAFAAPFMKAILTGERAELNADTWFSASLRGTGVAHVVAVSGMHVAFLAALLRLLFGRKRLGALLSIPLILAFMAVTGFSPSVVRAGVMQIVLLLASVLRRDYDGPTALALSLMLLLALNPVSVKNAGLQLSFAATLGLMLYCGRLYAVFYAPFQGAGRFARRGRTPVLGRVLRFLCATLSATLSALVFTLPISALYFGTVSLIAPLTNLLAVPLVTLSFTLGAIVTLLAFVWAPAASILAWGPAAPVWLLRAAAGALLRLPFASVSTAGIYVRVWLGFLYAELLLLFCRPGARGKLRLFALTNLAVLVCALSLTAAQGRAGKLHGTVLDVGQGQSVLLCSGDRAALVDCGGSLGTNAGDLAAEKLASLWLGKLDYLILTHFHADHANGAAELLRRVRVDTLLCPEPTEEDEAGRELLAFAAERGTAVRFVEGEPLSLPLGAASCTLVPPLVGGEANERGLSLLCSCEDFDCLLTGDMDAETEQRLLAALPLPETEVFVAGHHGSAGSNSVSLLEQCSPAAVIVSVGADNPYGHPAGEALRRFAAAGAAVYRTDLNGDVDFIYDGGL